jgi:sulfur carrier protein
MTITLNGKPHPVAGPISVADLLRALDINIAQVAVALNGEVIRRDQWSEAAIEDGNVVEVVKAVGGGGSAA